MDLSADAERQSGDETFDERQLVIFKIGKEEFGVNITEVQEIIRMESITVIPNTADYVEGVINLRGGIVIVINLAKKLGLDTKDSDGNTRIIVTELGGNTAGMIVDSATEVLRLSEKDVHPAPQIITNKIDADFVEGVGVIGERLLILLDLAKVIETDEEKELNQVRKQVEAAPPTPKEEVKEVPKEEPTPSPVESVPEEAPEDIPDETADVIAEPASEVETKPKKAGAKKTAKKVTKKKTAVKKPKVAKK